MTKIRMVLAGLVVAFLLSSPGRAGAGDEMVVFGETTKEQAEGMLLASAANRAKAETEWAKADNAFALAKSSVEYAEGRLSEHYEYLKAVCTEQEWNGVLADLTAAYGFAGAGNEEYGLAFSDGYNPAHYSHLAGVERLAAMDWGGAANHFDASEMRFKNAELDFAAAKTAYEDALRRATWANLVINKYVPVP